MRRFTFIHNIALVAMVAIGFTSCDDFLTIYPQDRIVEENFWEDKNDLDGIRYAAYKKLADNISTTIVWGDIRSDAYKINPVSHSDQGKREHYQEIFEGKLDSTMAEADWGAFYTGINYCNKILEHGQEVMERDVQFSSTEWSQMKAEITTLRALFYFYLLRAFKDIPYDNRVINSDEETQIYSATNQLTVLDALIKDVEAVKGQAVSRFASTKDTKGLITNTAIYALLADMYLWRSALREGRGMDPNDWKNDAQKVLEYGQEAINALYKQNEQYHKNEPLLDLLQTDNFGIDEINNIAHAELIANPYLMSTYGTTNTIVSDYTAIFYSQNSEESMFEIQYSMSDQRKNTFVNHFWGLNTGTHFAVNEKAWGSLYSGNDIRQWISAQSKSSSDGNKNYTGNDDPCYMLKWCNCTFGDIETKIKPTDYSNWIIYRKSDVMLMMAEAHAVLSTGKNDDHVKYCKQIVDAIHKRAQVDQTTGLSTTTDNDKASCIQLVMKERLIELMGEGKRWFDLVRYAERIGGGNAPDPREPDYMDGSDGVYNMIETFLKIGNADMENTWKSRFKNRYGLYCPIYYKELSANHYQIHQNPVWDRDKSSNQQ